MRICTVCKEVMTQGYCIEAGFAHYCSDDCRDTEMTEAEYLALYTEEGDTYWTEWEGEDLEDLPYEAEEIIQAIHLTFKNHCPERLPQDLPTDLFGWVDLYESVYGPF